MFNGIRAYPNDDEIPVLVIFDHENGSLVCISSGFVSDVIRECNTAGIDHQPIVEFAKKAAKEGDHSISIHVTEYKKHLEKMKEAAPFIKFVKWLEKEEYCFSDDVDDRHPEMADNPERSAEELVAIYLKTIKE